MSDSPIPAVTVDTAPVESITANRRLEVVSAAQFPAVPDGFRPTPVEIRRSRLRVVAATLQAECKEGLREATANAPRFRTDLGDMAPDPAAAAALLHRLNETAASLARARALVQYHEELEDIALSDATIFLEETQKELDHRLGRMPQLGERYRAIIAFFASRATAISQKMARAKAAKSTAGDQT